MAGRRPFLGSALLLIPLSALAGCTAAGPPARSETPRNAQKRAPTPPQPPTSTETSPAPASATPTELPPSPTPEEPLQPRRSADTVDIVDPGGDAGPTNLVQAAKAERERRSHGGESVTKITDKSLPHLPKGQLTYAQPGKKKAVVKPAGSVDGHDEQYWRDRALDIRTRWRKAVDDVKDLEQSAAGWRRRFYAENDPYSRDSQVKPEWDRVLDRLAKAHADVDSAQKELEDFLEEGRRAGALPGWLREGIEQEPAPEKKSKGPGTLEPKEPSVYHQQDHPPEKPPENHGALS